MKNTKHRTPLNEINVTPFVDVVLVLLVIFMLTAPLTHQGLHVNLPETKASGLSVPENPLVLTIKKNGALYISEKQFYIKSLSRSLKEVTKARKDKNIYIQADKGISYGFLARVMTELKLAGIYNIGLVTVAK